MFEVIFKKTLSTLTGDDSLIDTLWAEVRNHHSRPTRCYHNLAHLDHMATELMQVRSQIKDWQTLVLAVAYHDIVYDPTGSGNEEKSASLACCQLTRLGLDEPQIFKCTRQILATKEHKISQDSDTNFFTDADLSILGAKEDVYRQYTENIRKEYRHFPDLMYRPGRRKVLKQFLHMENIFKTPHFQQKYEQQARKNITSELKILA